MAEANSTPYKHTTADRIVQARSILASLMENGATDEGFSMKHEQVLGCLSAADELLKQAAS